MCASRIPSLALESLMKSLLAGFVLLSPLASAQNVVFQENFEGGVAQWTATGLWQAQSQAGVCASPAVPFPNGDGAAWYGNPATCSIDDGTGNHGTLKMNDWITLPTGVASVTLYFKSYVHSEYCWGGWDRHQVVVTTNGGPAGFTRDICTDVVASTHTLQTWHERRVDLTAYRGAQIKIAFGFISGDNGKQTGLGWLVDDVRVLAEPGQTICPSPNPSTWCSCPIWSAVGGGCFNALGKSATLISSGSASVSNDTLAFAAAEMIPGTEARCSRARARPVAPPRSSETGSCA